MNEDGTFKKVQFLGKELAGKAYFDEINEAVNKAYMTKQEELKVIFLIGDGSFSEKEPSPIRNFFKKEKIDVQNNNTKYNI